MPVLSTRRNVIVIADEAHRTQYDASRRERHGRAPARDPDRLHGDADREGRPLDAARLRRLRSRVYRMERAVEDGATVPIYYESRRIPLEVKDEALLAEVEEALAGEEDEAAAKAGASVDAARADRRCARAARAGRGRRRRALPSGRGD